MQHTGTSATLVFRGPNVSGQPNFIPDYENPGDDNKDNVYEVTLVVTDGTFDDDGNPLKGERKVTVKVLNSKEDNEPGEVTFSNRQPESGKGLTVTLDDTDKPVSAPTWQWYRKDDAATNENTACTDIDRGIDDELRLSFVCSRQRRRRLDRDRGSNDGNLHAGLRRGRGRNARNYWRWRLTT